MNAPTRPVATPLLDAPRSACRDSARWMRIDLPLRILPFIVVPLALAAWTPLTLRDLGLTAPYLWQQLALAALLGPPMAWAAWRWRRRYVPFLVVPTSGDALLQSLYYVVLNSPAEELLFRGALIGWLGQLVGPWPAWVLSTLAYALYHFPNRWGWGSVAGIAILGGLLGALFLVGPGAGSLVLPVIVHSFATCGFLSAGPWCARALHERRLASATPGAVRGRRE